MEDRQLPEDSFESRKARIEQIIKEARERTLDKEMERQRELAERGVQNLFLATGTVLVAAGIFEKLTGVDVTPNVLASVNFTGLPQITELGERVTSPESVVAFGSGFWKGAEDFEKQTQQGGRVGATNLELAKAAAKDYASRIRSKLINLNKDGE